MLAAATSLKRTLVLAAAMWCATSALAVGGQPLADVSAQHAQLAYVGPNVVRGGVSVATLNRGFLSDMWNGFVSAASSAVNSVVEALSQPWVDQLAAEVSDAAESAFSGIQNLLEGDDKNATADFSAAHDAFNSIAAIAGQAAATAFAQASSAMGPAATDAVSLASQAADAANAAVSSALAEASSVFGPVATQAESALHDLAVQAVHAAESALNITVPTPTATSTATTTSAATATATSSTTTAAPAKTAAPAARRHISGNAQRRPSIGRLDIRAAEKELAGPQNAHLRMLPRVVPPHYW